MRHCAELTGLVLSPSHIHPRAMLHFEEADGTKYGELECICHVEPESNPRVTATEAFAPRWHSLSQIPYTEMPEDDAVWYPRILHSSTCLEGSFAFNGRELLGHTLTEVPCTEIARLAARWHSPQSSGINPR